jgi:hypothetical protein
MRFLDPCHDDIIQWLGGADGSTQDFCDRMALCPVRGHNVTHATDSECRLVEIEFK